MANETAVEKRKSKEERRAELITQASDIEKLMSEYSLEKLASATQMQQTIMLAEGMTLLKRAFTDELIKGVFMPLMGSKLGFRTDRDTKPENEQYGIAAVRECMIEAMLRGARPVGNEVNLIADGCYLTREHFERRVREFPGVTNIELRPGAPHMLGSEAALVPYRVKLLLHGEVVEVVRDLVRNADQSTSDERIPVRVNNRMGADGILGKAQRKILKQVFERISGISPSLLPDGDVLDTTAEVVSETTGPAKAKGTGVDDVVARHTKKDEPAGREPGQDG
jgi:hypothetical protein